MDLNFCSSRTLEQHMGSPWGWNARGGTAVGLHEGPGSQVKKRRGEMSKMTTERLMDVYGCRARTPH